MSFWNGTRWIDERSAGQLPSSSRTQRLSLRDWLATIPMILLVPALISPLVLVGSDSGANGGGDKNGASAMISAIDMAATVVGTVAPQVQTPAPTALRALTGNPGATGMPSASPTPSSKAKPASSPTPTPTLAATPSPPPRPSPTTSPAALRTLYMSPTGSDVADGLTINTPFKSLRWWVGGTLRPGDTVLVRGGTYLDPTGAGETWKPAVSGTATTPITIKAFPGEVPVFNGQGTVQQAFVLSGVSYLTFEGLTFTRYRPIGNGVMIVSGGKGIVFRRITATANTGTNENTDHFFYVADGANRILFDAVDVSGAAASAILLAGTSNITVANSHLYGNGRGIISGGGSSGISISGNVIENNAMAQLHFNSVALSAIVSGNTLRGTVGIWIESLAASPVAESNNCIEGPRPFAVGWPLSTANSYTIAEWQATGRGSGTVVGACG